MTRTLAGASVLGPLSLSLDARPLGASPAHSDRSPACAFDLAAAAVPPDERRAFERARGTRWETGRSAGRARLECPRSVLRELGSASPVARLLAALLENAERAVEPPRIMGVLNATPDSFSDGGLWSDPSRAVEHGLGMVAAGACILDVGGESTRPGADPVSEADELARVLPVVEGLAARTPVAISIDTSKARVARAALDAGATIVNDVRAGADPAMLPLVAERGCTYVAMHMRGAPRTMQAAPSYEDPVAEVTRFLRERASACLEAGIDAARIVLDPGIGFGKRLADNLEIMRRLPELRSLGRPLLVGASRKSFIAQVSGNELSATPSQRVGGTAAAVTACVLGGAEILRVHDVAVMLEAARVAYALTPSDAGSV